MNFAKHAGRIAVITALIAGANGAAAQNAAGDAQSGRGLAQLWCAECHAIAANQPRGPNQAAPTFGDLAADPALTPARIRSVLRNPHRSMPVTALSDTQVDDVASYITSLRGR